ncbi:MAG: MFS transporter [Bacteroidetes bacterium CG02_land_8_20_14_3_00_31_25]|nr:MAG: MFS transporter [Bacteroidetes bacterium CG23_combo_of_CG06-09_8_20_14_all_32_9]PIV62244.1 MAG: MFS transporter [Bacteroidetes bacterium CG02_land_8_20_14_3_00_31_25]
MKYLSRTVWVLSLVSLFTDIASEMLYPVMPIYLKTIGFSVILIGILEGIAEATAGLSKGYFGKLSDVRGQRLPFVRIGYGLSAISKPLLVFFTFPLWIFSARTLDRLGKGVRTGARDALLSDEAIPETKGRVFGFHRALDTLGAAIGPVVALIFLYYKPEHYTTLFYIAFLPGLAAIILTFLINEKQKKTPVKKNISFLSFLKYWKTSSPAYRKIVFGLLIFTLFNSSDFFLLLKIKDAVLSDTWVIGAYIFYNLVYAVFSYPIGILADKIGLKTIFISGLVLFTGVYTGFAFNSNVYLFFILFFFYGIYSAATEGISKAWISNVAAKNETATAIGTFTAFQSICTMLASTIAGLLWYNFDAKTTFLVTAFISLIVVLYFLFVNVNYKQICNRLQ